jgi:hypothetical protein
MRVSPVAALVAVGVLLAACSSTNTAQPSASVNKNSTQYKSAYATAMQAYTYGLPLLTTNATFETMTSVNVSSGTFGPVNQFNNVRTANTASSTAVVAPGATSLSSIAWLDLSAQPQVLRVPKVTGHFFVLALIDPYTENIVNFGTASATAPGDYVIVGPGQAAVKIPNGTHRVVVDYSRIWIIGSTQLKGPSDVAAVNAIQNQYTLTPLSAYGTQYVSPAPSPRVTTVTQHTIPTGLAFFDTLGQQLALFAPPQSDAAQLKSFAALGIGPGLTPSQNSHLDADTRQALIDAVSNGPQQVQQDVKSLYAQGFTEHNGYLLGGFGTYGTDYTKRAVISQIGLGAFVAQQAIYAMAWSDHTGNTLSGAKSYVVHLVTPPPTNEGWSLTVYTLKGALVSNSIGRTAFTNISALTRNADGSIDIYLQSTKPTSAGQEANWLPTPPKAGFELTWRLFAPQPAATEAIVSGSGWQPPAINVQ